MADLSKNEPGTVGKTRYNLLDESFTQVADFQPDTLRPLGWINRQTLLLQVSAFGQNDQIALLAFHAENGSTTLFSPGRFVDFVYQK